jgi:hypothetical protein
MQFDRPIPGQSLTSTPKGAPYERPPEINDPMEALEMHLDNLDNPKAIKEAMFFLEMGVDVVTLVEGILRNAVMQGNHSIDVSLIIAPVIHEYIKGYADSLDIEYEEGFEDRDQEERISYARNELLARKVLSRINMQEDTPKDMLEEKPDVEESMPMMDQVEENSVEKPQGLMARI